MNRSVEKAQEVLEDDMVSWRTGSVVRKLRYKLYGYIVNYRLNLDLEFISQFESGIWGFRTGLWNLVVSKKHIVGFGYGSFMYFWRL